MKRIVLASHNKNKLREVREILPNWEVVGATTDAEETESTFSGNALIKARSVKNDYPNDWVIADDSGLEVDALGGAPGVFSARFAGDDGDSQKNNALLLIRLKGVMDRRAHFTCAIALISPLGDERVFIGKVFGTIGESLHGDGGFGYDPLFVPDGYEKTFSQLSSEEKNEISHRGRALKACVEYLNSLYL